MKSLDTAEAKEASKRMLSKLSRSHGACPVECHKYKLCFDKIKKNIDNYDTGIQLVIGIFSDIMEIEISEEKYNKSSIKEYYKLIDDDE